MEWYVWRCRKAGVWIARVHPDPGPPPVPLTVAPAVRVIGHRVFRWQGGRLGCSDLARIGLRGGDKIEREGAPWLMVHDIGAIHECTNEAIASLEGIEPWSE